MSTHTRQKILEQLYALLRERLEVTAPLTPDTELLAGLKLDSIQQFTLVVELENHFEICFDPGEEQEVRTLAQLTDLVLAHLDNDDNDAEHAA